MAQAHNGKNGESSSFSPSCGAGSCSTSLVLRGPMRGASFARSATSSCTHVLQVYEGELGGVPSWRWWVLPRVLRVPGGRRLLGCKPSTATESHARENHAREGRVQRNGVQQASTPPPSRKESSTSRPLRDGSTLATTVDGKRKRVTFKSPALPRRGKTRRPDSRA